MKQDKDMQVGLVFGTFDIIHAGHISFLRRVKKKVKKLVVLLNQDSAVKKRKGSLPVFNFNERKHLLLNLKCVDVLISGPKNENIYYINKIILKIKPDAIFLSSKQNINKDEIKDLKRKGLNPKIIVLPAKNERRYSSSIILRRLLSED